MAVPELGWSTLAEATSYFADQRLSTTAWDGLADDDAKNKVLNNAYNRIKYCPKLSVPASPSAAELIKLKLGQWEFAYYLATHLADEDRRMGLQAQHVVGAGIVKETYDKDRLDEIPIPQFVLDILIDFNKYTDAFVMMEIDRDEDESVDEDVVD